jgi:hypothetical protein
LQRQLVGPGFELAFLTAAGETDRLLYRNEV